MKVANLSNIETTYHQGEEFEKKVKAIIKASYLKG